MGSGVLVGIWPITLYFRAKGYKNVSAWAQRNGAAARSLLQGQHTCPIEVQSPFALGCVIFGQREGACPELCRFVRV
jgi:hypothetical protein